VALFVIACGITLLQVAANPYVAVVGPPATAPSRLNLVAGFNSLGTTLAPLFGGYRHSGTVELRYGQGGCRIDAVERLADVASNGLGVGVGRPNSLPVSDPWPRLCSS